MIFTREERKKKGKIQAKILFQGMQKIENDLLFKYHSALTELEILVLEVIVFYNQTGTVR